MTHPAILYPVFAPALWTGLVLLLILIARIRAGRHREIVTDDFKYGEASSVLSHVALAVLWMLAAVQAASHAGA